ncbi:EAL domain-containing protein [Anaerobacillus alkaliphilus]|uniref:EAL domain-containing protein n=1 Tax=Anaerobacillus alkaliphilus TaxID=1548597 RepID=A0A4Q0VVP4_9BACI|nr:HDOD domain-containing protein [Anaerobacillus alkaliphilus]RXJ02607.1 EAL domain-containing protein [Anaerobacillus alkaliphilus]
MEIFVARQPILTSTEDVVGYELLYRNSHKNMFTAIDGNLATIELLINSFVSIGKEKLSSGKKLYINFTRNLLLKRVPCLFSPDKIVIEILEDVAGDAEIIEVIKEMKQMGYTFALDDYTPNEYNKSLLPYTDILKVDFLKTSVIQRKVIHMIAKEHGIKLLAEKVESRNDFEQAIRDGYDYYQGYFFSRPIIIASRDIPFYPKDYLSILTELYRPEPNIDIVVKLIECDLSISYRILKIVNTMAYFTRVKVTSIRQAVLILGLNELIKLLTLISLKEKQGSSVVSHEIVLRSMVRAKFAEQLGNKLFQVETNSECFMLGLFSLIDTILQQPMDEVLKALPFSEELKQTLIGQETKFTTLLQLVIAGENADWDTLQKLAPVVDPINISACYENAIHWATKISTQLDEAKGQ